MATIGWRDAAGSPAVGSETRVSKLANRRCAATRGPRLAFASARVSRARCRGWLCPGSDRRATRCLREECGLLTRSGGVAGTAAWATKEKRPRGRGADARIGDCESRSDRHGCRRSQCPCLAIARYGLRRAIRPTSVWCPPAAIDAPTPASPSATAAIVWASRSVVLIQRVLRGGLLMSLAAPAGVGRAGGGWPRRRGLAGTGAYAGEP